MNPAEKAPAPKRPGGRTVTVTLSLPTVISGLIMLCAGFVGVFALGIILGRGHNIESRIPQLERIMPQPEHTGQPRVIAGGEVASGGGQTVPPAAQNATRPEGGQAAGRAGAETRTPPADPRNQTMDQGDLAYRDSLKHQQPKGSGSRQQPKGKPEQPAKGKTEPPAKADQNKPTGREVFNYVYQVAASKDSAMADKLAAKLKAAGLKARTEKSQEKNAVWYRTVVDFRGTPDETDGLRAKLKEQGLGRPILKSKTQTR